MSELSDKVQGWGMTIVGAAGVFSGVELILYDSKNIIGYLGSIASVTLLGTGIEYLRKVYSSK